MINVNMWYDEIDIILIKLDVNIFSGKMLFSILIIIPSMINKTILRTNVDVYNISNSNPNIISNT